MTIAAAAIHVLADQSRRWRGSDTSRKNVSSIVRVIGNQIGSEAFESHHRAIGADRRVRGQIRSAAACCILADQVRRRRTGKRSSEDILNGSIRIIGHESGTGTLKHDG